MGEVAPELRAQTPSAIALPLRPPKLLDCDLVMKGGITSGLVYPKAVVRFARDYQVRNVGGTSIGAIAAALTAGAEYQRQSQPDPHSYWSGELDQALAQDLAADSDSGNTTSLSTNTGFSGRYTIPNDIGGDLLGKFQPEPETKPLFGYLMRLMTYGSKPGKVVAATFLGLWIPRIVAVLVGVLLFGAIRVLDPTAEGRAALAAGAVVAIAVIAIARKFRPDAMPPLRIVVALGAIGALLVSRFAWIWLTDDSLSDFFRLQDMIAIDGTTRGEFADWRSVLVDLLPFAVLFWIIGAVVYLAWAFIKLLPTTDFGICSGMGDDRALTNWLHARLNVVAGLPADDVLTFGQLERHGVVESRKAKQGKSVNLVMITTDIRRGVPLDIPRALTGKYFFKPEEFTRFFPPRVIAALVDGATPDADGLCPFPPAERIPVLVAARMSMSFPILFCAIPVHYRDSDGTCWKTWLSDGGIVSNFPSNKFDRALPPWPTFGLDLVDVGQEFNHAIPLTEQHLRKWLCPRPPYSRGSGGVNPERLPTRDIQKISAFLMGAFNAARGWMDNSQKRLPGFAERIVAIKIYEGEGGLNLAMGQDKIQLLARRGLVGADELIRQWMPDSAESQWRYHRWVRLRTLMREMEEIGRDWKAWYEATANPLPIATIAPDAELETFEQLAGEMPAAPGITEGTPTNTPPPYPYPWRRAADLQRAQGLVEAFNAFAQTTDQGLTAADSVDQAGEDLGANAAAVVFDAPDSPSPNPTFLLMPPFV